MKAIRYIAVIALVAGLMVACQREPAPATPGVYPEGAVAEATFTVPFPADFRPATRAQMGEGPTVDAFQLFLCLYGPGEGYVQHWIPTELLDYSCDENGYIKSGTYHVFLPLTNERRVVHFYANPPESENPTTSDYIDNVMEKMVDTDGECSYWQQIILENGIQGTANPDGTYTVSQETNDALDNVHLVRNFAKLIVTSPSEQIPDISTEDPDDMIDNPEYEGFTVKRWTLINVPSSGYVAPYTGNKQARYPTGYLDIAMYGASELYAQLTEQDHYLGYMPSSATIVKDFPGDPDAAETASKYAQKDGTLYFYERPLPTTEQFQTAILAEVEFDPGHDLNTSNTDPVTYWYKIEVLNDKGQYVPFLRDFVYRMSLREIEDIGAATAKEAFDGPYFGNISASLETASLNELSNGTSLVHVDEMDYTFLQGGVEQTLMKSTGGAAQYWFIPFLQGNPDIGVPAGQAYTESADGICEVNVTLESVEGYDPAVESIVADGSDGSIKVTLLNTGSKIKKSIIRVAGTAEGGKEIYREITINLMETQTFKHGDTETAITVAPDADHISTLNQKVVIKLQLPEDLGASLFPLQVRIEAEQNSLSATSSDLPVVTGKSVFASKADKNTFFYVKTIKYSDYRTLNKKTKKYEYKYDFDCVFYTTKNGNNSTKIDIRDMKTYEDPTVQNFAPMELTLGTVEP